MSKKYFIIAGEASGDMHASNLVKAVLNKEKDVYFEGFGGEMMRDVGVKIYVGLDRLSLVGFVEILKHIKDIKSNFRIAKEKILILNPDALILIDYPGFNLRMAKWAKSKGIKVYYYVAPQVWAWGKKRVKAMKKYIDKLFVILPFEEDFFKNNGIDALFVGHPLLEEIAKFDMEDDFLIKNSIPINKKIVAFLPGSRDSEIKRNIHSVIPVINHNQDKYFLVAAKSDLDKRYFEELESLENVKVIFNQTYKIYNVADAGIIKSGTSTLEAALFELPQVVVYKVKHLSYLIAKKLVKDVKFVSLVNLILDKEVVKELLQYDFNPDNLDKNLNALFEREYRNKMLNNYQNLKSKIQKNRYASDIVADEILRLDKIND